MFKRRRKLPISARIRECLWPRAGWRRLARYTFHRMARLPGTPHSLAAGFACGAAISFTPFVGLHIVLSATIALIIRANILSSAIGTAVGNPWTFPFIWIWTYEVGLWMGAGNPQNLTQPIDFISLFGTTLEAFLRFDMVYLLQAAWPVWWPMFVGGIPTGILVWLAFYFSLKPVLYSYRVNRGRWRGRERLRKKQDAKP
jgi:uncharacterized protein (DUF2062 family)